MRAAVEFAGWEMPVEYSGIVAEHMSVRTAAGLFDVSHMGEIEIRGREALKKRLESFVCQLGSELGTRTKACSDSSDKTDVEGVNP